MKLHAHTSLPTMKKCPSRTHKEKLHGPRRPKLVQSALRGFCLGPIMKKKTLNKHNSWPLWPTVMKPCMCITRPKLRLLHHYQPYKNKRMQTRLQRLQWSTLSLTPDKRCSQFEFTIVNRCCAGIECSIQLNKKTVTKVARQDVKTSWSCWQLLANLHTPNVTHSSKDDHNRNQVALKPVVSEPADYAPQSNQRQVKFSVKLVKIVYFVYLY